MTFLQFMECLPSLDALDDALKQACLRWATAEDGENETDVNRLEGESTRTAASERCGVISFQTNISAVHVVLNLVVRPFFAELPWNQNRLYIWTFFGDSEMRRRGVHD